jgi:hypothetical protein
LFMKCLWTAPLTMTIMVMKRFIFQPLFFSALINGSYLLCSCVMACFKYMMAFCKLCELDCVRR